MFRQKKVSDSAATYAPQHTRNMIMILVRLVFCYINITSASRTSITLILIHTYMCYVRFFTHIYIICVVAMKICINIKNTKCECDDIKHYFKYQNFKIGSVVGNFSILTVKFPTTTNISKLVFILCFDCREHFTCTVMIVKMNYHLQSSFVKTLESIIHVVDNREKF